MRVTIFSSNQPRHLNLALEFSRISDQVFLISEVTSIFPGKIEDFYRKSEIMQKYFSEVIRSESKIFGDIQFLPNNVSQITMKMGDLNHVGKPILDDALSSDIYVVFGASYIKGWLVDYLVEKKAINIHMGLSPYYRGSSCNFWALYDNNPGYVGATIHLLSKGLDSGEMLFHCIPENKIQYNLFDFTMSSVKVAQQGLVKSVLNGTIFSQDSLKQDKRKEIRYSRDKDFNDNVASEFLKRNMKLDSDSFSYPELLNPIFG